MTARHSLLIPADDVPLWRKTGHALVANSNRPAHRLAALFAASRHEGALRLLPGEPIAARVRLWSPELIEGGL